MNHRCLSAVWPTCPTCVDGGKRYNSLSMYDCMIATLAWITDACPPSGQRVRHASTVGNVIIVCLCMTAWLLPWLNHRCLSAVRPTCPTCVDGGKRYNSLSLYDCMIATLAWITDACPPSGQRVRHASTVGNVIIGCLCMTAWLLPWHDSPMPVRRLANVPDMRRWNVVMMSRNDVVISVRLSKRKWKSSNLQFWLPWSDIQVNPEEIGFQCY